MYPPRQLLLKRRIQPGPLALWKMSTMQAQGSPGMGCPFTTRTQVSFGRDLFHAHLRRIQSSGKWTTLKARCPELDQEIQVQLRSTTPVLHLRRIRGQVPPSALPWNIIWQRSPTRTSRRKAVARSLRNQARQADRRNVAKRVNICKGLRLIDPGRKHHQIHSQLHFEETMVRLRLEQSGVESPVPSTIYRPAVGEEAIRRLRNKERINSLRNPADYTGPVQDGWSLLSDPPPDP